MTHALAYRMDERLQPLPRENVDPEDLALEALLALRRRWNEASHTGHGVTLRMLGLELESQERYLSAVCATHRRFHILWRGSAAADRPERVECPGDWHIPCRRECQVDFVYAPARPPIS